MNALTYYTTDDGAPWGVFVKSHVELASITRDDVLQAIRQVDPEAAAEWRRRTRGRPKVRHLWMRAADPSQGEDDWADPTCVWCEAHAAGAFAVTGMRFT